MEYRIIFLFIAVISSATTASDTKKYRDDYVYNRRTDAFYKLHTDSSFRRGQLDRLAKACEVEGATLMSATSSDDIMQLHIMMKNYPDIGDNVYVASDGITNESAEQQPIIDMSSESGDVSDSMCEAINRDGKVVNIFPSSNMPFVCKVKAKDVPPYNQICGVHARGYRYYSSVSSCYRIPPITYTWYQAYDECRAEGAHLAILNSDTERIVLQNITSMDGRLPNSWNSGYFHIGFKAEKSDGHAPRVFKTVFNQTLEETGFSEWSATEPNNVGGRENCGSIYGNDGKLNDINCSGLYAFICEKEVQS